VVAVPDVVRNKAEAVGASAWLESLPDLVRMIENLKGSGTLPN